VKELGSAKEIWERALGELQIQVSKANYDTWLRNSWGISCQDDVFVVGVPNTFIAEWLAKRLHSVIRRTLANIIGRVIDVQFVVHSQEQLQGTSLAYAKQTDGGTATKAKVEKFNPRYTFDNFMVGDSNRLAYAAAMEVAENLEHTYNPLFIYGDAGQGKTHLLHAIGHTSTANNLRVIYITGEQFTNEFIFSIRQNRVEDFRNKFNFVHLLLFDDVQFLSDKKQTLRYFLHIFNELHNNNCQIIITADRSPKDMVALGDKLRSRFEWGLVVQIQAPDFETRLSILQAKAKEMALPSSDEILRLIAERIQGNIRQLEGVITCLIAQAKLAGTEITPPLVNKLLTSLGDKKGEDLMVHVVADHFNVSPEELLGKKRTKNIVLARQILMYILRQETNYSFTEIGKRLGDRNHVTIMYGYRKIADEIKTNPELCRQLLRLHEEINSCNPFLEKD